MLTQESVKWLVRAVRGRERTTVATTYVSAKTQPRAIEIGKEVLRTRIKGRCQFSASVYRPEFDRAFRGYLSASKGE
jgi:hypothetical protein